MNVFSPEDEKRLLELVGQRLGIAKEILQLTEKQRDILESDDMDAFGRSLDNRQELIEKINGLHQETTILMQSYLSFSEAEGGRRIGAIDKAAGDFGEILTQCISINDNNTVVAKEKAEEYLKQAGKLNQGRKSLSAYIQSVPNEPELFDRKT